MALEYRRSFSPRSIEEYPSSTYVYTEEIVLAVNVALATGRPLLVRGPSGCGKSTLARNVAAALGRRYLEQVISSRTQARDLLWQVDLLRRLQDAQAGTLAEDFAPYVLPGVLWWAFDPESARAQAAKAQAKLPSGAAGPESQSVVLLDEIDKADPDVPNNLLAPLGEKQFQVDETGEVIHGGQAPLLFLTTNDERDLPPAFVRRCVELKIGPCSPEQLVAIGRAHFANAPEDLLAGVAKVLRPAGQEVANPPSTAEYLDTVRACQDLGVAPGSASFEALARVTVWKHGRTPGETYERP